MADVITVVGSITHVPTAADGRIAVSTSSHSKAITMTGKDALTGVMATTSWTSPKTEVALDLGNKIGGATLGYVMIKNIDLNNSVLVGKVSVTAIQDGMCIKLLPGEFCVFRASEAIYISAFTTETTPEIQYWTYDI